MKKLTEFASIYIARISFSININMTNFWRLLIQRNFFSLTDTLDSVKQRVRDGMFKFLLAGDEQFKARNKILEFRIIVLGDGLTLANPVDPLDRVFRRFVRLLWS